MKTVTVDVFFQIKQDFILTYQNKPTLSEVISGYANKLLFIYERTVTNPRDEILGTADDEHNVL